MCGIAGQLNWSEKPDAKVVARMCERMHHRGPDDGNVVLLNQICLGHRRLSIIDLSEKAAQPMNSSDGRYYIVYNGEVYNFQNLKDSMIRLGIHFNTSSDTEVVLQAYILWGEKCLEKFNGMFALAIWDNFKKELFLARDRFGQKPLYYYFDRKGGFSFASELSALLCEKNIPKVFSMEALNCYLALGYILSPMTCYKGIFKLEQASWMKISNSGERITKEIYWDYSQKFCNKTTASEDEIAQQLLDYLEKSIKRRMISDVPVGAFLSGGIDSTSIVSIMKQYHSGPLHTFSIGFDVDSYNELPDADRVANWIGSHHHGEICNVKKSNLLMIEKAVSIFCEPFADTSLIPTSLVSKLASDHVKVALSGDGADELFAGYVTYKADKYYRIARHFPGFLKRYFSNLQIFNGTKKLNWQYKTRQFFYGSMGNIDEAHYCWRLNFRPEERVQILGVEHKELVYDTDPFKIFQKYYEKAEGLDGLDRNLYVDCMTWLHDDILVKVDRASMRHSIEARCPYLDFELAEFVASIPSDIKLKGFDGKYILKKALKGVIPDFVFEKKKSGFNAPVGHWIKNDGRNEFNAFNEYVYRQKVLKNAENKSAEKTVRVA
ncbi:MAG: asparagine synthase (glutamine-hydrolyzing) [Desulfobacteraceae bacterium]|nr:asparagine synthase (glutamine-hydrolyzing) [Desulfobacteraceae bacterium]